MIIRPAHPDDIDVLYPLLKEFSEFLKIEHLFEATKESLHAILFEEGTPSLPYVGTLDGKIIAFSNINTISSTFMGEKGYVIEDLYVHPSHRGKGFGTQFLSFIAEKAEQDNYKFLQWKAFKDNPKSIEFYNKIGAEGDDMVLFLLTGQNISKLAKRAKDAQ